ncbi:MAG TPA: Arc family DNA-binding protein [Vicinamibacteria bacterium]
MAERKTFLLRMEPEMLEAVQVWANDELRSVNAQIEFLLRDALRKAGRLREARERKERRDAKQKA